MTKIWNKKIIYKDQKSPLLLVAPHGLDDDYTADIVYAIADEIGCSYLINSKYFKSKKLNTYERKADCNRISHISNKLIYPEYLSPFLAIKNSITKKSNPSLRSFGKPLLVIQIHGYDDSKKEFTFSGTNGTPRTSDKPTIIVGYKERLMINNSTNEFFNKLRKNTNIKFASRNSIYAGKGINNVNNIFSGNIFYDQLVSSYQFEISLSERNRKLKALGIAGKIKIACEKYLNDYLSQDKNNLIYNQYHLHDNNEEILEINS